MIAVVVQVPLAAGRPQLGLPAGVEVVREGDVYHVNWGEDHAASLRFLGTPTVGQDPVFVGGLTPRAAQKLKHLGARVVSLLEAWERPALKAWLVARGVVEVDGEPVPPHVIAGA